MNSFNYILVIIITLIFLINNSNCYFSLGMNIEPYQERCLSEYYTVDTILIIQLTSYNSETTLEVKSPNGRILYNNKNTTSTYSFTTTYNGYYSICITNNNQGVEEVELKIKSGIEASDYSSLVKSKDIEPIDIELNKILEKRDRLTHFNKISQEKQEQFNALYTSLSRNIIFYSLFIIGGMIFIGVLETLYLKRFMERRKII